MFFSDGIGSGKCIFGRCALYAALVLVCSTLTGSGQPVFVPPIKTGEKCESPKPLNLRPVNTNKTKPSLTYPELITALSSKKLPAGMTREKLMAKLISDVKKLQLDKPLTGDREDDLIQAGAWAELLTAIRT